MSEWRQQTWIEAPVDVVWDLIVDVESHPEWWPTVVEVECDGLEPDCTFREVLQHPVGRGERHFHVERLQDCEEFLVRCVTTGTFVHFHLTEAQDGTFVDSRAGMEPKRAAAKLFDVVAGKRYFRHWLASCLAAMRKVATERARAATAAAQR